MRLLKIQFLCVLSALLVQAPFVHATVTTIRTGQVGGVPGVCPGTEGTFRYSAPQPVCGQPILSTPFSPSDFDQACNGNYAVVINPLSPPWTPGLDCDPDARWINASAEPNCYGTPLSVLYCADFDSRCPIADSIKICWAADDVLGDPPGDGPNNDGMFINGVSLGPAFAGGNAGVSTTSVAYNVPLVVGTNHLQVYQRDGGCVVAGLILNAKVYTSCGSVPTRESTWGSIKSTYR